MRTSLYLSILSILLLISSCSKKEYCTATGAVVCFKGYDTAEIKEIKIISFAARGSFSKAVDSSVTNNFTYGGYFLIYGDTIITPLRIPDGEDFRVTILPANRTWSISEVQYQTGAYHSVSGDKRYPSICPLGSCLVDGKLITYPSTDDPGSPSEIVLNR